MKKIIILALAAVAALSFTSCASKKSATYTETATTPSYSK
jgi:hypothetical protein